MYFSQGLSTVLSFRSHLASDFRKIVARFEAVTAPFHPAFKKAERLHARIDQFLPGFPGTFEY
jgi:hypothetical protein